MRKFVETKEITLYSFNELSQEGKEKVREWYLNNQESSIFTDMILDDLKYGIGFKDSELKIQYDLGYCQGDGLNIYGKLDFYDCLKIDGIKKHFTSEEITTLESYFDYCYSYDLEHNNRYCYCIVDRQNIIDDLEWELENEEVSYNKNLLEKFNLSVKNFLCDLCATYEECGYNYFYEIDDNDLNEICDCNNYEFLEDGTLY